MQAASSSRSLTDSDAALELEEMFLTRRPEEIFAAEDARDWNDWVDFFSRTREADEST